MRFQSCVVPLLFAATLALLPAQAQPTPVQIQVHADHPTGPYHPDWNYFGADEPNYITASNGRKLLRELHDLSPYPVYFRPHNLLTTGTGEAGLKWGSTNAYTENPDGSPHYDWTITDQIFDALQSSGVRPLVEVGFMPEALSNHPEPYRHNFPNGDVFTGWSYPPKDDEKWGALVEAYARHLKQRYGSATDTWLWEVWNEPDIAYWHGTPEEYDHLYDVTTAAIRKVLPAAKVGGPAATGIGPTGSSSDRFLKQFLTHCATGTNTATGSVGAPLDFISYHPKGSPHFDQSTTILDYAVMPGDHTSKTSDLIPPHVEMGIAQQLAAMDRGMKIIASYPQWRNTPILLTETDPEGCAACKGPQNGYRNGPLYGVSVAEAFARLYELAARNHVNLQGAVTWAFEFEDQPAFAGFRELASNGIDKPVLNVFRMFAKLNGDWVQTSSSAALPIDEIIHSGVKQSPDINAIATRSPHELNILLWNYHDIDLPSDASPIAVTIDGLPAATVQLQQFRMDADHSNAYTAWQKLGSPAHPTPAQQSILEQASHLESLTPPASTPTHQGTLTQTLTLPRQAVSLLHVTWK
jgi:xylan 1,4-beta-xylosidase